MKVAGIEKLIIRNLVFLIVIISLGCAAQSKPVKRPRISLSGFSSNTHVRSKTKEEVQDCIKAAEEGDAEAQNRLGDMYRYGQGVSKNYQTAVTWYTKSAQHGNVDAQYSLGVIYYHGLGILENYKEAFKWYRRAANQDHAIAQYRLGIMYLNGRGVLEDSVEAYKWFMLAAMNGEKLAQAAKDNLCQNLTNRQLEEAQRRAKMFLAGEKGSLDENAEHRPTRSFISRGTGFAISPEGHIVTAYHVIERANKIKVYLSKDSYVSAQILHADPLNDLAVLKVHETIRDFLVVAPMRSAGTGDRVFTIGFPASSVLGREPKYTEGVVSSLSGIGGASSLLQITVPVQSGNSGGPLVNESGEVVGIITSTAAVMAFIRETGNLPQNVNWAVKADYLRPLIELPKVVEQHRDREQLINHVKKSTFFIEAE